MIYYYAFIYDNCSLFMEWIQHKGAYYYYYYHHHHNHHHHRISHFSALAGKYSPILGCSNQQDWARWS